MKLFKKVLAVALAGVLALSVLTGCGDNNSSATVAMIDALNDWSKVYNEGVTFKKGDADLQNQANALVDIIDAAGESADFEGAKDFNDIYEAIMNDETTQLKLTTWGAQFAKAKIGDGSPLYMVGFADINATLSASSSKNIYYAQQLMESNDPVNMPKGDYNAWIVGNKADVVIATGEVGGKKYMVALFKTTAEANPDYVPGGKDDTELGQGGSED